MLEQLRREDVDAVVRVELTGLFHEARGSHQKVAIGWIHLDEDVDVAALAGVTSGDRAKRSRILRVILRR